MLKFISLSSEGFISVCPSGQTICNGRWLRLRPYMCGYTIMYSIFEYFYHEIGAILIRRYWFFWFLFSFVVSTFSQLLIFVLMGLLNTTNYLEKIILTMQYWVHKELYIFLVSSHHWFEYKYTGFVLAIIVLWVTCIITLKLSYGVEM